MRVAALIFDLDGTLTDPVVGIGRSLNYALEAFGYGTLSAPEVSRYVGPPLEWTFRQIDLFGLREHFNFVNGGDVGVGKGDQLRALLDQGTIGPASTMIGDRAVDIEAARVNGLGAVGVLWGHGTKAELLRSAPDRLLESPIELAGLCGGRQLNRTEP